MSANGTNTRERILDAAQSEVMKRGFAATSIDAIQEAAEISRGTFFYHFRSKDEMARDLLHRYAESDRTLTLNFMARAEKLARDPLQQALLFLAFHEEMFEEMDGADAGCLFASYSYEAGLFDDDAHRVIADSVAFFRNLLGDKLRQAKDEHEPAVDFDPHEVADLAYGVSQGAFILSRVYGDPRVIATHIRHFRNYVEMLFGKLGSRAEESRSGVD